MTAARRLLDDCFLHDRDRLRHTDVIALLRERVTVIADTERVTLGQACGRILAETIAAPNDVPLNDNAAVDGYAFSHASYVESGGVLQVTDRVAAGHPAARALAPGEAARIFTGAVMPEGADTVAMQEDCTLDSREGRSFVSVPPGLKPGANRRRAGEDVAAGTAILDAGHRLRPQDVAAIASIGKADIIVHRRIRVALISTGDEILRPGTPLKPGQVYDSNHYLVSSLIASTGAEVSDLGILQDEAGVVHAALAGAADNHDVVLTTGGASRGEEDHMVTSLDALGSRHLWQLAIKPGRPMMMGQIGQTVVAGLPGNPVAAMVCFLLYVRPMLFRLGGAKWPEPVRYPLPARFAIPRKKPDRREFLRGILDQDDSGRLGVTKFDRDGSGLISGLREADGLIEIAEDVTEISEGDIVSFIPFAEFGI